MNGFIHIITLTAGIFLAAAGCEDRNTSSKPDIPSCIQQKIDQLQAASVRNPPGSVWQYEYRGETVYYIPAYCCDIPSQLLDSACNQICNPDGGYTGEGDGKCIDFFERRQNEKLIWKDNRQ